MIKTYPSALILVSTKDLLSEYLRGVNDSFYPQKSSFHSNNECTRNDIVSPAGNFLDKALTRKNLTKTTKKKDNQNKDNKNKDIHSNDGHSKDDHKKGDQNRDGIFFGGRLEIIYELASAPASF